MVTEAAENNGPMIFARMGMTQAINRHRVREFTTTGKTTHWGRPLDREGDPSKNTYQDDKSRQYGKTEPLIPMNWASVCAYWRPSYLRA
jgi:hypothetical protein